MLKVGIVGLPNVGKSTIFNALLKKQVADVANYPFCTIEPNVGVIAVPDARLPELAKVVDTNMIIPAAIEFYDIAGLVRGASEGEGLGNKFLSHIRETALVCHVVRLFEDTNITHIHEKLDPLSDMQTIETELMLADISVLSNQKEPKGAASQEDISRWEVIQKVMNALNAGTSVRDMGLSDEEKQSVGMFNLLTLKPVLYVCNVSEKQLTDEKSTLEKIHEILPSDQDSVMICAHLEQELSTLPGDDQKEYLKQYGLQETSLGRLVTAAYHKLQLISFLTAGPKEVRAWTIPAGTRAPQAAGVIHTDFERHFIKAEIVPHHAFIQAGGWQGAREKGLATFAGKEYIMKDGDVVDFKVGAQK